MMNLLAGNLEEIKKRKNQLKRRKESLYKKNFLKNYNNYDLNKSIYYGVKWIIFVELYKDMTIAELKEYLSIINTINNLIKQITFKELINIFPIIKDFDGKKFESKDYFSTMEWLNIYDFEEKIDEDVYEFFFNYYNHDIINYSIKELLIIDKLRKVEGNLGIMEEFLNTCSPEINSYSINDEFKYIKNNRTGEIKPYKKLLNKRRFKNFKLIKK